MCGYWQRNLTPQLTLELVRDIAVEAKDFGVTLAVFSGGEPLLHPDIIDMCSVFRQFNIPVTVLTNGLLLEKWAERLISVSNEIIISLDGPREVHDDIRGIPGAFDRIHSGVNAIRANSDQIKISGRCTVQKRNLSELRRTVAAAHTLGLEKISFLAVSADQQQFKQQSQTGQQEDLLPSIQDLAALKTELTFLAEEYAADYETGFIAESPEKHHRRLYQYFKALHHQGELPSVYCNAAWFSAVIESSGDVRACFFTEIIGNVITDGGLKRVLTSEAALNLRNSIRKNQIKQCSHCVSTLNYKD